jgi:uncharacterized repeat protein (TIGR03803 family)
MQSKEESRNLFFRTFSRAATAMLTIATVFTLTVVLAQPAQAQTFTVIHTFTGGGDGANSYAGLTMDQAGNLYGTASLGGGSGNGTVFRLSQKGSGWVFTPLYSFQGSPDGATPEARVVFGPDGILYGTTSFGGACGGCGTVFNLKPYPTACKTALCGWQETVLYSFTGGTDGMNPGLGDLIFDQAGNLYGTTSGGGAYGYGAVFELVPSQGGWTEKLLYSFTGGSDGSQPFAGLIFDNAGNLYGTTVYGGTYGWGTVYELTPSGSGWTVTVLYTFQGGSDGRDPFGGLIFDQAGNLYGDNWSAGPNDGGTVFELAPSNGSWTYSVVYGFKGYGPYGPAANLVMQGAGNLYGTTVNNGHGSYGNGNVFELTSSGGSWTYTSLYDFTGGNDGAEPLCTVIFDANGNLYGTTYYGGADGNGVVWEITP